MTLRALLVDDERLARTQLKALLRPHPDIVVVGEASCVAEAMGWLKENRVDLIFLDVEMPGQPGHQLDPRGAKIIFVTAHAEHAVKAFELEAVDYLLKPLSAERLSKAVARLLPRRTSYLVRDGATLTRVSIEEVVHIKSAGDYSEILLERGEVVVSDESLSVWQSRIGERGVRLHRAHLASVGAIVSLEWRQKGVFVRLKNGEALPVARRRVASVREKLGEA